MSEALEYIMVHAQRETRRRAGDKGSPYQLFEWYAALFPEMLSYAPGARYHLKLDEELDQSRLGALKRKKATYEQMPPSKLRAHLESSASADGTDLVTYLRERWDDEESPWMTVVADPDLMGFADEPFLDGYLGCLGRDFAGTEGLAANLEATRAAMALLRRRWLAAPVRYTFDKTEVLTFLIFCAVAGPGDHAEVFELGYADEATIDTSTGGTAAPRSRARLRAVSFKGGGDRDWSEADASMVLGDGQAITLTRRPGFRRTGARTCEFGVGAGDLEISREHARIDFDGASAQIVDLSSKPLLIIRWEGGRRVLDQGEAAELRDRDVVALAPYGDGSGRLLPRRGETGVQITF